MFFFRFLFILFIYTIFQEGNTFGIKAILPCGPLYTKIYKTIFCTQIKSRPIVNRVFFFSFLNPFMPNEMSNPLFRIKKIHFHSLL